MKIAQRSPVGERRVALEESIEERMEFIDGSARFSRSQSHLK